MTSGISRLKSGFWKLYCQLVHPACTWITWGGAQRAAAAVWPLCPFIWGLELAYMVPGGTRGGLETGFGYHHATDESESERNGDREHHPWMATGNQATSLMLCYL